MQYIPGRTFSQILSELGQRVRQLRLTRNLTQEDLGKRAGVGTATIQRFEKSGHCSLENALRVASALVVADGFDRLFEIPAFASLDEILAQPSPSQKSSLPRARARRGARRK